MIKKKAKKVYQNNAEVSEQATTPVHTTPNHIVKSIKL
uniref:Bm13262, isoform b n=1 Tax=Brugia malayi TaxID=6279 RepID=A0A1I9G268_BRUMA|nr:Bm13262, isoform b [Brugia malayi]